MILHLVVEGLWDVQDVRVGSMGNRQLWQQLMVCRWLCTQNKQQHDERDVDLLTFILFY